MTKLNVWPFYEIDNRTVCSDQYWGSNKNPEN